MRRLGNLSVLIGTIALSGCAGDDTASPPITTETTGATGATTGDTTTVAETTDAPAATVMPTTAPVTVAPASTQPATADPAGYDFSAVSAIVDDFVEERGLNGAGLAIVHRDDGLVHHEHWGEFGPDRVSLIASSSKMLVAGVLLRLQDEGLLDVDRPIADLVDWGAGNPDITPAQLVSNSSGLVGLLPDVGYAPYLCQFLPTGTLQECAARIFTTDGDDPDIAAPDSEFRYGGAQWQVAGAVAEVVSGETWAELVDRIYVAPCGVDSLGFNNHFAQLGLGGFAYPPTFDSDPSQLTETDNPNMEAGAYITSGDYAELLLMHLRGGRCGDEQVLSEAALERLHGDRIAEAYGGAAGAATGYGMGWWIDRNSGRRSDQGAYGSVPWLDLEDGYGVYLVIEADAGTGNELAALLYDPVEAAITG